MPSPPPGIGTAIRIFRDDQILLRTFSRTATQVSGSATVIYDDGQIAHFPLQLTTVIGSIVQDTSPKAAKDGWVVGVHVGAATRRGRLWAEVRIGSSAVFGNNRQWLCYGYLYAERNLTMGVFDSMVGGVGFKSNRAVADDIAPVDIQESLAITNTLRRIDGFIWYYHCSSDVADRTLRASLRDLGDGLPTGMTSGGNTLAQLWPSAAVLTLSANQEGTIIVKDQFAVSVDTGTPTFEDPSSRPNPFPYWAQSNDTGEFFFDVTDEEAADRHSIYIIEEEWIQIG